MPPEATTLLTPTPPCTAFVLLQPHMRIVTMLGRSLKLVETLFYGCSVLAFELVSLPLQGVQLSPRFRLGAPL
jgi:hypothetical protein